MRIFFVLCSTLLFNFIFQVSAFASQASGTVSSFVFHGEGKQQTFSFKLSSTAPARSSCNSSGLYTIRSNEINAVFITSLIINLHNGSIDDSRDKPVLHVVGTGKCTYTSQTEDVKIIILKDQNANVFVFPSTSPYFKPTPVGDLKYALPPVIRNMSSRNQSHHLEAVAREYEESFCKLGLIESTEKLGTARSQLANSYLAKRNPLIEKSLGAMQLAACSLLKPSFDETSKRTYKEQVVGKAATAMWRTNDGAFHGAAFFFEDGKWKVDINFNTV